MSSILGVIADDLTGACDVGVQFRKRGLETVVLTDAECLTRFEGEFDVVVVDTESRNVCAEFAYRKTRDALKALGRIGAGLVYKKVDSTLRGNMGAELDAVLDELKAKAAIVAPSFPGQNRTTVEGRLLVDNTPVDETEFAQDPLNAPRESCVAAVIGQQTARRIGHIGLSVIRSGVSSLRMEIRRMIEQGNELIVADSETGDDLARIAAASVGSDILLCGSAGLAEYVSGFLTFRSRFLVVSGSVNTASLDQIETAERELGARVLEPDLSKVLASEEGLSLVIGDLVNAAERALAEGRDVIVRLVRSKDFVMELHRLGRERGLNSQQVREKFASILRESCKRIVAAHRFGGLILIGGDTSTSILEALGAEGIRLESDLLPGIPSGRTLGGKHEGMRVVTKAGGFGDSYALVKIMESLRSAARTP